MSNLDYVRLDVGHYLFTCHANTLRKFPNSVLAKLISQGFDNRKSNQDYIVIDRDGKNFGLILNYLRDPRSLNMKSFNEIELGELSREADFYGLTELVDLCDVWILHLQEDNADHVKLTDESISHHRLEIIFGYESMVSVLKVVKKPTLVLNLDQFLELKFTDSIEMLVSYCSTNKIPIYGFKKSNGDSLNFKEVNLSQTMTLFEPDVKISHKFEITVYDDRVKLFNTMLEFMLTMTKVNSD